MHGFLNLHKPFGWTSHDCVAKTRKLLHLKRVGHAGTLDPAATGVLPIALGKATRLLQYLPGEKAYIATIRFGIRTATDDMEGEIIAQQPVTNLSLATVKTALTQFCGKITQIPPSYSAIQVQGKRLYDLARQGEIVEAPARVVEVSDIQILDWREGEYPELDVAISCGTGTYIRAIARDLGQVLTVGGTLAKLQRTSSSGFHLGESLTFSELETQLQTATFHPLLADQPLQHLPQITLPSINAKKWCQGQRVDITESELDTNQHLRVYAENGQFLGIGKSDSQLLIPQMVFESFES